MPQLALFRLCGPLCLIRNRMHSSMITIYRMLSVILRSDIVTLLYKQYKSMNYNNSTNTQSLHSLLHIVFALCLITSAIAAHHKSKMLEDLPQIKITHQNNSWQTNLNIAHHTLQLTPKILPCRSWIKSSQCKICD